MELNKQQLIADILGWEPTRHRGILESLDVAALKDVLAKVVQDYLEAQQDRLDEANANVAVQTAAFELNLAESRKPLLFSERQAAEKENRRVFVEAATAFGFSEAEANFSVLCSALGHLDLYGIQRWISERPETLVPATPAELEQRRLEAIAAHNQRLLNASPLELRELSRQEAEARRTAAQRTEQMTMIETTAKRDNAIGFPVLPTHNSEGVPLDRSFFLKLLESRSGMDLYKQYLRKHGSAQITARLNGIR